jgi:uncharacterized protein
MEPSGLVEKTARWLASRPWRVVFFALVLSGLSVWGAVEIPFFTSRKALLPRNTEVSRRLQNFIDKFGAASDLFVVVDGAPRPVLEHFVSELAGRLRRQDGIQDVLEKIDIDFFLRHAYLLVPAGPLKQFQRVLGKLISVPMPKALDSWEEAFSRLDKWLDEPPALSGVDVDLKTADASMRMVIFALDEWLRWIDSPTVPEEIDWQRLVTSHGGAQLAAGKGYFTSHDGKMFFLFVHPTAISEEFKVVKPLIAGVRKAAEDLRHEYQKRGGEAPRVHLTGLPAVTYEEFDAIQHDIVFTVSTAAVLIMLLIGIWLRSLTWALVVFAPMGLGVLWNIGLTYLTVGHLTMITSAFTAILFGLGVDYGIFMSTRIMEERTRVDDLKQAIGRGVASSARAILTAGGATVLIFLSLTTVSFSGFADMGLVAACGVLLVLISTFCVQPALFALLPPPRKLSARTADASRRVGSGRQLKVSRPVDVLLIVVALAGMIGGVVIGLKIPFNYDVLSLLPAGSEAAHYQREMVKNSDYQAEAIIFTADSMKEAQVISEKASKLKTISQVQSVTKLFPPDAGARVKQARAIGATVAGSAYLRKILDLGKIKIGTGTLARIRSSVAKVEPLIEDAQEMAFSSNHKKLVEQLEIVINRVDSLADKLEADPKRARERTEKFARALWSAAKRSYNVISDWQDARPLDPAGLPTSLKSRFIANDGSVAVYAFPARSVYDPVNLSLLLKDVYSVSKQATGFPTTHQVFSHMAVDSFRQGTIVAVCVAVFWILLIVRRLRGFIIALLPLLIGGGWMIGIIATIGMEFSYANIIALPLVMGLAIDYGVWYAHRRRERPDLAPWQVAGLAGRAILLAAGTTLAGLGAITLASYRGVANMGISVTIGLLCCVMAALLVSPAVSEVFFGRRK